MINSTQGVMNKSQTKFTINTNPNNVSNDGKYFSYGSTSTPQNSQMVGKRSFEPLAPPLSSAGYNSNTIDYQMRTTGMLDSGKAEKGKASPQPQL